MAEVVRYVDPDATGSGTGLNWTDAYVSLDAWESAEQTDLVSAGDWHHVYCRSSAGTRDTSAPVIDVIDWTTSATNYILIEAASGHEAVKTGLDTSRYICEGDAELKCPWIYVKGIQFTIDSSTASCLDIDYTVAGSVYVDNCYLESLGRSRTVDIRNCDSSYLTNNVMICHSSLLGCHRSEGDNDYLYNCVIIGGSRGVECTGLTEVEVINCAVFGSNDNFSISATTINIDHCASDDGDGSNPVAPSGSNWANEFPNYATGDVTLVDSGNLYHGGTPVSGLLYDIDGDEYHSTTPSIGVDEIEADGSASGSISTIIEEATPYDPTGSYEASVSGSVSTQTEASTLYDPVGSINVSGSVVLQNTADTLYDPAGSISFTGGVSLQNIVDTSYDPVGSINVSGSIGLQNEIITLYDPVGSTGTGGASGSVSLQNETVTLYSPVGSSTISASGSISLQTDSITLYPPTGSAGVGDSGAVVLQNETISLFTPVGDFIASVSGSVQFVTDEIEVFDPAGSAGVQGSIAYQVIEDTAYAVSGVVYIPVDGEINTSYETIQLFDPAGTASGSGSIVYAAEQIIAYDPAGAYTANVSGSITLAELQDIAYALAGVAGTGDQGSISFQVETISLYDLAGELNETTPIVPWTVVGKLEGIPAIGRVNIPPPSMVAATLKVDAPVPVTQELTPKILTAAIPETPVPVIQSIPETGLPSIGASEIVESPDLSVSEEITPKKPNSKELEELVPSIKDATHPY